MKVNPVLDVTAELGSDKTFFKSLQVIVNLLVSSLQDARGNHSCKLMHYQVTHTPSSLLMMNFLQLALRLSPAQNASLQTWLLKLKLMFMEDFAEIISGLLCRMLV